MNLKEIFTRKIKKYDAIVMVKTLQVYFLRLDILFEYVEKIENLSNHLSNSSLKITQPQSKF